MTTTTFVSGTPIKSTWLNDVNGATYNGSALFTPSGTGAVSRTAQSKMRERVSITDYGAVGNAATNCGPALQAAHDALGPNGGTIQIPSASSYYLISSQVAFTKPIRLVGDGWYNSVLYSATSSLTFITTTAWLHVEDICFQAYGSARTTACFIKTLSAASSHGHTTLDTCYFDGGDRCYWSQSTNALTVNNCIIGAQGTAGLYLENTISSDIGDSFITNNTISGSATTIGIIVASTSGLYITNNKFNNEQSHVLISTGALNGGDYTITGNSFEGHTGYAIKTITSGGTITKTLISGNQFSATTTYHIDIATGSANTAITGNTFNHTSAAQGTAIIVEAGSYNTTITGNAFHQILNAIYCASNATLGVTMSGNRFASDVTQVFVGDDGQNVGVYGSTREINVSRYFQESASVLTSAYRFQGNGTLEIMVYGLAQGASFVNWTRKVAVLNTATVADINAAVAQGSAITVALTAGGGFLDLQVAKSAGTSFTGYVEVIARGQISYVKKM